MHGTCIHLYKRHRHRSHIHTTIGAILHNLDLLPSCCTDDPVLTYSFPLLIDTVAKA
jgi:hypothetical protein